MIDFGMVLMTVMCLGLVAAMTIAIGCALIPINGIEEEKEKNDRHD